MYKCEKEMKLNYTFRVMRQSSLLPSGLSGTVSTEHPSQLLYTLSDCILLISSFSEPYWDTDNDNNRCLQMTET